MGHNEYELSELNNNVFDLFDKFKYMKDNIFDKIKALAKHFSSNSRYGIFYYHYGLLS